MLGNLGCDRDFPSYNRAFGSVSQQGSLCHDMVLRLQVVDGSRQESPQCRNRGPHSVTTMSRQRFSYRDRDSHDKRSGLRWSLVKAKRFRVTTGFHGVVSRQGILCRDSEWTRSKDLGCDRVNYVATE